MWRVLPGRLPEAPALGGIRLDSSRGRSRPPAMVKSTLYLEAAVSMRGICGLVAELFYRRNKIQSVRKLNGQQLP